MKFLLAAGTLAVALIAASAGEATITIHADKVLHPVSRYLTGACLEDVNHEVYGGLYSQMIYGESFQEPSKARPIQDFREFNGAWNILDNHAISVRGGDGPKIVADGPALTSGEVSVEMRFNGGPSGNGELIFKVSEARAGADEFNGYEASLAPSGELVLGRHRHNWELIQRVSCNVALDQWIKLTVKLDRDAIDILVDGIPMIHYVDTQHPLESGTVGLRVWQRSVDFRNLEIKNGEGDEIYTFAYADGGEGFGAVSGMWDPVTEGTAAGTCLLETTNTFVGTQSQQITCTGGTGEFGIANQSLNRWGMNFVPGNEYDGCLDVRADNPVTVTVSLESQDGTSVYASQNLSVTSNTWEHLNFSLTPAGGDGHGRFVIGLKQPGSVQVGYAFLEPGPWGLFKGLPVRRDVAEGLVNQGITVLRYGGSMVNASAYRWKNMIGPRDRRPPYMGTWYPYSSDGWGIPDFLNFCEAAGFLGVPDFNINETPQDMADFVEYVNGATNTAWGAQRLADGHPKPYGLKFLELGNEETVNNSYYQKFQALAKAIWAADTNITPVVGDFTYSHIITNPFSFVRADSGITSLAGHQQILQLARQYHREVWFDVHVWTEGPSVDPNLAAMFSYDDALGQIANGAKYKVVVFELNAENHTEGRALGNALTINAAERDGRLPIVTSANCLQPDGQNDNSWDQGLLFLNQSNVWLQPPGYVTQLFSEHYQPVEVWSEVTDSNENLDVTAERSQDGSQLVIKVVNPGDDLVTAFILLDQYSPRQPFATVEELAGPLDVVNSAKSPGRIRPTKKQWITRFENGKSEYGFPPHSITLMELN
ncbi:MAG: family 16 glycoside hydrolase [Verrucomicrobiota bacterium]